MTNRKPERHLEGTDKGTLRSSRLRLARLPIHFFMAAVTFFGLGVVTAPWVVSDLVDFFYHPWLLAVTHIFTLGWITSTMMGVMYRYVPALTKNPLRFPRLALASGLLTAQVELARLGAGTIAVGGVVYVAVMLWTLRYAYRRSVPTAARNPLRVLPGGSANL